MLRLPPTDRARTESVSLTGGTDAGANGPAGAGVHDWRTEFRGRTDGDRAGGPLKRPTLLILSLQYQHDATRQRVAGALYTETIEGDVSIIHVNHKILRQPPIEP